MFAHSVWVLLAAVATADPQYQIYDLGVVQVDHPASYGYGTSSGGMALGCGLLGNAQGLSGSQAFTWTQTGGLMGLPNLAGRNFCLSKSANGDTVVGSCPTSAIPNLGDELPVIWQDGVVSQLPLPKGYTIGAAHSVNASGIAVGSVGSVGSQRGVIYTGNNIGIITQTTPGGSFFTVAYGINDSGRIAGRGSDNLGIVHDTTTNTTFSIGAFQGTGNSIAYGVNNSGVVVGWSFPIPPGHLVGLPFVWSEATGMVAIPVVKGTEGGGGQAVGVNSDGWVVGKISTNPFLFDGTNVYRLADLLPEGSGWNLSTASGSLGISDNGTIVGTGRHNNQTRAYAMVPVQSTPTPTPTGTPPPMPPPTTTHFVISASVSTGIGAPLSIAVSARDQFNHTAVDYSGTVHFTSTSSGTLPPNTTLTNGTAFFVVTLNTPGNQTITATDISNSSITGTSNPVYVPGPQPTPFARPTATATVTATVPPTPTATPTPCLPVITQSTSHAIATGNSASCNDGVTHTDNSYWRAFDMAAYAGGNQYCINSVSFGVEFANTTQPVTVRLYRTSNFPAGFPGSLTQIATATINVGSAQNGTIVTVPLVYTAVPAGTPQLVMELFTPNGNPWGYRFFVGSNAALQTGSSYFSAPACGITTPITTAALGFPNMHLVFDVNGSCTCATPTPCPLFSVTGTVGQCTTGGPSGVTLPGVTITRTGSGGEASTVTDNSGNYFMQGFSCGTTTLTPSKAARPPGSNGIDTVDALTVQRHFLSIGTPLTGCRLTAGDCVAPVGITTGDVIAIQRYFLSLTTGIGNVGQYSFTPSSRSYSPPTSNQGGQNYDAIVFGDVNSPYAVP